MIFKSGSVYNTQRELFQENPMMIFPTARGVGGVGGGVVGVESSFQTLKSRYCKVDTFLFEMGRRDLTKTGKHFTQNESQKYFFKSRCTSTTAFSGCFS